MNAALPIAAQAGTPHAVAATLAALDGLLGLAIEQQAQRLGPQSLLDPWRGMHLDAAELQRQLQAGPAPTLAPAGAIAAATAGRATHPVDWLANAAGHWPALARLARQLALDALDTALLVVVLAPELDLRYERLYAYLQDDVSCKRPSLDLLANLLATSVPERLAVLARWREGSALTRHAVLQCADTASGPLLARPLRVASPWLEHLLAHSFDADVGGAGPARAAEAMSEDPGLELAQALIEPHLCQWAQRQVRHCLQHGEPLRLVLQGAHGTGKFTLARAVASALGLGLLPLDLREAQTPGELAPLLVYTARRASLQRALPYLLGASALAEREARWPRHLVDALCALPGGFVMPMLGPMPALHTQPLQALRLLLERPSLALRERAWRSALAETALLCDDDSAARLAARFKLSCAQIAQAAADAGLQARLAGRASLPEATLAAAARALCGDELARLAHRVHPRADAGSLILPPETGGQLRELCARVAGREAVQRDFTAGSLHARRCGVTALFAGPSGTGKTLAAEVIAHELGLDLFCIDLSAVVSKYIGETEKNLDRVFAAAENANAVLFFDEADALFGKRSEVKDAHDRYANIEISYLLQKMERFDGLAILATNLRQNIDDAFTRRLTFAVGFPFPEQAERLKLWHSLWPARAPRAADVDLPAMAAEHRFSGGQIRNVVIAAVHLAAGDGQPVGHAHLLHALRREYQKLGKQMALPVKLAAGAAAEALA